ncbi:MAG: thioredoxin [Eubacterium sp.]|nr:thioredoxin [Eubacterium sp.]
MAVIEINDANFDEKILNADKPALVDFYAVWCGPCKMMSPIVEEIAEEHPEFVVGKCDVDEAEGLAVQFGIMSIPTLLVFKNGELSKTFIGVTAKEEILDALQ